MGSDVHRGLGQRPVERLKSGAVRTSIDKTRSV